MRTAQYPKQLTISLTNESYTSINEFSDEKHVSMSDVIRDFLDSSLMSKAGE